MKHAHKVMKHLEKASAHHEKGMRLMESMMKHEGGEGKEMKKTKSAVKEKAKEKEMKRSKRK